MRRPSAMFRRNLRGPPLFSAALNTRSSSMKAVLLITSVAAPVLAMGAIGSAPGLTNSTASELTLSGIQANITNSKTLESAFNKSDESSHGQWFSHPDITAENLFQLNGSDLYIWPTKGVFTSGFGMRWGRMHQGIDLANKIGTPIVAAKDGVVAFAGWSGGYGYLVEISHTNGESTRYAHNSQLFVSKGQLVPQGALISKMGSTGRSTGPHLHFEIRQKNGAAMNPVTFLPQKST